MLNIIIKKVIKLLLALCLCLCISTAALKAAVSFKVLYYMDIKLLRIEARSELSYDEIKNTYSYIIDYLTDNKTGNLEIPNFNSSSQGVIHFKEVKKIISEMNIIFYSSLIIFFLILYLSRDYIDYSFLKTASLLLLAFVSTLIIELAVSFDKTFTAFHELFFKNNYWLFDPVTDPVINILPEEFFYHCTIFMLMIIVIMSLFLIGIYRYKYDGSVKNIY